MDKELNARNQKVFEIVSLLSEKKYDLIKELDRGDRLSAEDLKNAVLQYGRTITRFPKSEFSLIYYVAVPDSIPECWVVTVPLFTVEEGRSDLSLELTLIKGEGESYEIEIDDCHVL